MNNADLEQSMSLFNGWKETWGGPILHAAYNQKFDEGRIHLAAAKENLRNSTLPEEIVEALWFYIVYMTCRLEWDPNAKGYTKEEYDEVISHLSIPAKTQFADYIRVGYLLDIRSHGTSDSYDELEREEVDELLKPLPDRIAVIALHQLARWAFERREIGIVEQAFESFLLFPSKIMSQAKWQRVNLMYQIMTGKVTRRDVLESIKVLEIRPQLIEFQNEFWPECVKLGLVDAELEQMLADKEAEIMSRDSKQGKERKTKSFLGTKLND